MRYARFTLAGEPVAKGRPKIEIRYRDGRPYPHVYPPDATAAAEGAIGWAFKAANPGWEPLIGPVTILMVFSSKRVAGGDWDNYGKLCCDALNGIAWNDDKQIVSAAVSIRRAVDGDAQTYVWIEGGEVPRDGI